MMPLSYVLNLEATWNLSVPWKQLVTKLQEKWIETKATNHNYPPSQLHLSLLHIHRKADKKWYSIYKVKFWEEIKYISHKRCNQGQYTQILSEGTAEPALVKYTWHKKKKQQSKHAQLL